MWLSMLLCAACVYIVLFLHVVTDSVTDYELTCPKPKAFERIWRCDTGSMPTLIITPRPKPRPTPRPKPLSAPEWESTAMEQLKVILKLQKMNSMQTSQPPTLKQYHWNSNPRSSPLSLLPIATYRKTPKPTPKGRSPNHFSLYLPLDMLYATMLLVNSQRQYKIKNSRKKATKKRNKIVNNKNNYISKKSNCNFRDINRNRINKTREKKIKMITLQNIQYKLR